jgi:hypothetical protein
MPTFKSAAESRRLRLWLFTVLYFVQGIPSGFFLISLPGWFAQHGLTKGQIGLFIYTVTTNSISSKWAGGGRGCWARSSALSCAPC